MSPYSRLAWALGSSLIIWAPVALSIVTKHTDLATGGIYYLGALLLTWFGTGLIDRIMAGYRQTSNRLELAKRQIELIERRNAADQAAEPQHRRSTDDDDEG